MDTAVNAGAIAYGIALILGAFVRTPLTEALRIDALFIPGAGEKTRPLNLIPVALALLLLACPALGQPPAPPAAAPAQPQRPPTVVSPDVLGDGRVTFRIYAPNATRVFLNAGDLPPATFTPPGANPVPQTPGSPGATVFAKGENGVWEFTPPRPFLQARSATPSWSMAFARSTRSTHGRASRTRRCGACSSCPASTLKT